MKLIKILMIALLLHSQYLVAESPMVHFCEEDIEVKRTCTNVAGKEHCYEDIDFASPNCSDDIESGEEMYIVVGGSSDESSSATGQASTQTPSLSDGLGSAVASSLLSGIISSSPALREIIELSKSIGEKRESILVNDRAVENVIFHAKKNKVVVHVKPRTSHALSLSHGLSSVRSQDPISSDPPTWASEDPEVLETLETYHQKIFEKSPTDLISQRIQGFGARSLVQADHANVTGDAESYAFFLSVAKEAGDFLVGLDPITSTLRGLYELYTGSDLFSGEELTNTQKAFIALNIISIGFSGKIYKGLKAIFKVIGKTLTPKLRNLILKISDTTKNRVLYGPHNVGDLHKIPTNPSQGPIVNIFKDHKKSVAYSFRGGSYYKAETTQKIKLYRVYSDDTKELGSYWTRTKPTGPSQSQLDFALDQAWKNKATKWVEIELPKASTVYEGAAASVKTKTGELYGGSSQVYLEHVKKDWVIESGNF